jgi:hypothetical protein
VLWATISFKIEHPLKKIGYFMNKMDTILMIIKFLLYDLWNFHILYKVLLFSLL